MKYQTSLLRWAGLIVAALVVVASAGHQAWGAADDANAMTRRADVVTIDAMAKDGKLELPAVVFLHDQHTKALEAVQKDCSSCHKPIASGSEAYSFTFMRAEELKGDALKALYHTNCIGCHTDMGKAGKKTGPVEAECRSCHVEKPLVQSDRQDIGLDKAAHYKHIASAQIKVEGSDKNCAACHHVYDAAEQKLVYAKDKEDSCRACHKLPDEQVKLLKAKADAADANGLIAKRPTLDAAAHQSCVNCHLQVEAKKEAGVMAGPVTCAGCHSPAAQATLAEEYARAKTEGIPRLERGQADAYLMLPATEADPNIKGMMRPVSFNHKFHESSVKDCRTCHHKQIDTCVSCHSLQGKPEGNYKPLAKVMHEGASERSCVGCHNIQKQDPSCAGCHTVMPLGAPKDSCASCHNTPKGMDSALAENGSLLKLDGTFRSSLAGAGIAERESAQARTFAQDDIPETVSIGILSNEYQPSELPHRKIVNKLLELQKDNRLAAVFHTDPGTLCQGCHHNSPVSKTPPKCASCHSIDVQSSEDGRLHLKAAYHQQCMTCHARMNQKPAETACNDCHKPRGK